MHLFRAVKLRVKLSRLRVLNGASDKFHGIADKKFSKT